MTLYSSVRTSTQTWCYRVSGYLLSKYTCAVSNTSLVQQTAANFHSCALHPVHCHDRPVHDAVLVSLVSLYNTETVAHSIERLGGRSAPAEHPVLAAVC